jgi:hypothetical protein
VQLDGVADEPAGAERDRLRELYCTSYPDGRARLAWPELTHFRIVPSWARSSDFAATPAPLIVEVDFAIEIASDSTSPTSPTSRA